LDSTAILALGLVSAAEMAALRPARPDPIIITSKDIELLSYCIILSVNEAKYSLKYL
jgi:hypothetical protein